MKDYPSPLLGYALHAENSSPLDLSAATLASLHIDPTDNEALSAYIFTGKVRYGGYGERRSIYGRSALFEQEAEPRNIHLGVDIWAPASTAVFAPWAGTVITAQDNAGEGNYGPTIILQHQVMDHILYSLHGHLSRSSLTLKIGSQLQAGERFASFGTPEENGGWPPHLHFQLIRDLEGNVGDYPGVCAASEWERYRENCPKPGGLVHS